MAFLWYILIGAAAGWLAGQLTKGKGFGILGNILVGIVGGVIGGWVFGLLGLETTNLVGSLVTAVVGALILIGVANMLSK